MSPLNICILKITIRRTPSFSVCLNWLTNKPLTNSIMTKKLLMIIPLKGMMAIVVFAIASCNKQQIKSAGEPQLKAAQAPYEIARWSGFRNAAVSYTFDDNCSNQVAIAIPALNTYGFKGTFFLVTNWGPNWTGYKSAATNGHEIASHTASHPSMGGLTVDQQ